MLTCRGQSLLVTEVDVSARREARVHRCEVAQPACHDQCRSLRALAVARLDEPREHVEVALGACRAQHAGGG